MKILVTSGGTKVLIDPVRSITNMSSGRFGSQIAMAALEQGHEVQYLVSKGGRRPFSRTFSCNEDLESSICALTRLHSKFMKFKTKYHEVEYEDFVDYHFKMQRIRGFGPDIIILAAAVSDYFLDRVPWKISSSAEMSLHLRPTEKIIKGVKTTCPDATLVGFKLLVHVAESELIEAAKHSIKVNRCDLVVANDLNTIKEGAHEIHIVEDKDGMILWQTYRQNLAETVVLEAVRKREEK